MNKLNKLISLYFYDEEKNSEYQLKLKLENILLFRDSLVKKMRTLRVKVESQKLIKGQQQVKRLTEKEIKEMKINDIEKNTNELKERIEKGEITDYTVNTFTTLCGKAIEHFSMIGNDKYKEYVDMMKNVLQMEKVNKLTIDDEKEIKDIINKNIASPFKTQQPFAELLLLNGCSKIKLIYRKITLTPTKRHKRMKISSFMLIWKGF